MRRDTTAIVILVFAVFGLVACKSPAPAREDVDASRASSSSSQSSSSSPSSSLSAPHDTDADPSRAYMNVRSLISSSPIADADRTIAGLRPLALACYEAGLREDPHMAGTVTLAIDLSAAGEVRGARIASNLGLSTNVAQCVASVARHPLFDPTANGTTLTVALVFGIGK